jgi:hypothetical protein
MGTRISSNETQLHASTLYTAIFARANKKNAVAKSGGQFFAPTNLRKKKKTVARCKYEVTKRKEKISLTKTRQDHAKKFANLNQ